MPPIRPLRPAYPDPVGRTYGALAAAPLLATVRDPLRRGSLLACRAAQPENRGPVCRCRHSRADFPRAPRAGAPSGFNRLSYSRALRAGKLRAPCPHIHEFACELLRMADRKRFPRDSRSDQETQIRKRNRHRWTVPARPGPRNPRRRAPACAAATVLLGVRGLLVTAVTQTPDGQTLVEVITDLAFEAARCCPRCGKAATRVKERPRTAPRDVFIGDRQVLLDWRKTRWHCDTPGCEQGTFTEWLPAVKRRARLTSRLRTCLGEAVGDDLTPAAAAARRYGVSDRTAARAFTAYADSSSLTWTSSMSQSRRPGSMSSAAAPPPTAPTRRPARSPGPAPNGSPTWSISAAAAPWAWPGAVPPPRRRTCSPGTPPR